MGCRVKIQRNLGLLIMFDYIQLLLQGMETFLMEKLPACVCVVLFIMILRQERKILPRMAYVAIFCVIQSLETKFRSQVRPISFYSSKGWHNLYSNKVMSWWTFLSWENFQFLLFYSCFLALLFLVIPVTKVCSMDFTIGCVCKVIPECALL